MSKPLVLVIAPVNTRSGYGNHGRDICRALIESDKYDVKINATRWGNTPMNALEDNNPHHKLIKSKILQTPNLERQPDLCIQLTVPNEFQPLGKKNIGFTAGIEHTIAPAEWLEGINRMDKTIVTSEFSKEVILNTVFDKHDKQTNQKISEIKVNKPVDVLFEGTDETLYGSVDKFGKTIEDVFNDIDSDWNFLFTGHWLQGGLGEDRKDIGMMIKVFLEVFKNQPNPPGLILKTSGAGFSVIDREQIKDKIQMIKDDVSGKDLPPIYLIHGDLTDSEINELYNHPKVKSHLSFTHGEGFGRPLLEASFSGKPIISPIWSGQKDFLDPNYTVGLGGQLTNVPNSSFPKQFFVEGCQWFTVNYGLAGQIMKDVFKNYNKYLVNAQKLMIINKSKFTHDKMREKLESIIDDVVKDVPKQVKLNLPKLKKV
tara:strand:- start:751 stop:2034 length:1284 start_codon:yes stop_codon:yes gene_type:complete